jgi:antitoxin (DNA-binding transcriptional repressor) of toxin-antitoxin stability system
MTVIGATHLRSRMDEIFDRVLAGEEIIVHHRFKGPIKLSAAVPETAPGADLVGLAALDAAPRREGAPPPADLKAAYHTALQEKYLDRH